MNFDGSQPRSSIMMACLKSINPHRDPLISEDNSSERRSQRESFLRQQQLTFDLTTRKSHKSYKSIKKTYKNNNNIKKNMQKNNPKQNKKIQLSQTYDQNYNVLDLTYTFVTLKLNHWSLSLAFGILIFIRYYTLIALIYVFSKDHRNWGWVIVISLTRLIFVLIVIKISLKVPQTHTELILKKNWNCMVSEAHEYFQVINMRKLCLSILRGLVPPQLSFIYIESENVVRRFEIFSAINYIIFSIEAIVYYPFFIIYSEQIDTNDFYSLNFGTKDFSIISVIAAGGEGIIVSISIYLMLIGLRRKYGSALRAIKNVFKKSN